MVKAKTATKTAKVRRGRLSDSKAPCKCLATGGSFRDGKYVHADTCSKAETSSGRVREALAAGPQTNRELREKLGVPTEKLDPKLDRKLQQMRKSGELKIVGNRWALQTVEECPTCHGKGWVNKKAAR